MLSGCWLKDGLPRPRLRHWVGTRTPSGDGRQPSAREGLRPRSSSSLGVPPALGEAQQATLKGAVQELPEALGIGSANWNWKVVRQFVAERFCVSLSRSSCLNYLHRLGFAFKRPKKRLVKADGRNREAFVAEYAALADGAKHSGGKIFFADEAHFRADAELRGKWVLRGEPALVDSNSPRRGEKASYYSAVCLETGEVEWMELDGNSNSGTSVAFLRQLQKRHHGPLNVIWDNAPAHRGEAVREYLGTPSLGLSLVNLPGYSPDFNADEAVWGWAREEATGNLCLGSKTAVQERVGSFLAGLSSRKEEVQRRCRTVLQSRAGALLRDSQADSQLNSNAHPTLALVWKIFRDLPTMSRGDLRLLRRPLRDSLAPSRKSLSRLWPVQMSSHSRFTFSRPRSRNWLKPWPSLI